MKRKDMHRWIVITACLLSIGAAFSAEPPTVVYLAGDSTMAQKLVTRRPETGWGEQLQQFFDVDAVRVENHARNGRSTRTFITEGRWARIVDKLKEGDYVFIQFGHNDGAVDRQDRYTPPNDYRANLLRFIADVQAKKATPVLLTPVMRRRFDDRGKLEDSHGIYPVVVREVAAERKITLLDMHRDSAALLSEYGPDGSIKLFMILAPGENSNYPQGLNDNTHFTPAGALAMATLAAQEIAQSKLPLVKSILGQ